MRMPRFVPVPVETTGSLTLFRSRRDFGISAIIVGLIATVAVGASVTASAMALSTSVQTVQTVNDLSASVSVALDRQSSANTQIQGGLMLVNQRIDLVQEQLDILWQLAQLGCEQKFPGLCVTSIQYENFTRAANLSKDLSSFILQNWIAEFEQTLRELRMAIIQVNSTRLDLSLTEEGVGGGGYIWSGSLLRAGAAPLAVMQNQGPESQRQGGFSTGACCFGTGRPG